MNLGIKLKNCMSNGGYHAPRNSTVTIALVSIMFAYSPRKNKAKPIDEYSTWYPATNSLSASGKSKGCLLVSAKRETKNIISIGNNSRSIYHGKLCFMLTISVKFSVPVTNKTQTKHNPMEISYEIICAAQRMAPKNAYAELLDHPANNIPYTPIDDIARK